MANVSYYNLPENSTRENYMWGKLSGYKEPKRTPTALLRAQFIKLYFNKK